MCVRKNLLYIQRFLLHSITVCDFPCEIKYTLTCVFISIKYSQGMINVCMEERECCITKLPMWFVACVDACAMACIYLWRADVRGWAQMSGKKRRKSRGRYVFDLPILFLNISLHVIRILHGDIDPRPTQEFIVPYVLVPIYQLQMLCKDAINVPLHTVVEITLRKQRCGGYWRP